MPSSADALAQILAEKMGRRRDRAFLEAVMATCALVAAADRVVTYSERSGVERILVSLGAMGIFDPRQTLGLFDEFVRGLDADDSSARHRVFSRIKEMAGDRESSETLVRIAIMISQADGHVVPREVSEIKDICRVLGVDLADVDD